MSTASSKRIYGFDLLRFFTFLAIMVFHWDWMIFYTNEIGAKAQFPFWQVLEDYGRVFAFGGQIILFLSSVLLGRAQTSLKKPLILSGFAFAAWLMFVSFEYGQNEVLWVWDIYALIAVGVLFAGLILHFIPKSTVPLIVLGLVILSIPFWEIRTLIDLPLGWRQVLIGECNDDLADWPLLPWVGLIFVGYGIGYGIRHIPKWSQRLAKTNRNEIIGWVVLLLVSSVHWGAYFTSPVGPGFACFMFRQPPIFFFANMIPIVCFLRFSFVTQVNQFFGKQKWIVWLSKLRISTHFGMLYVLHWFLWFMLAKFAGEQMRTYWQLHFAVYVLTLPVCELILRRITKPKKF